MDFTNRQGDPLIGFASPQDAFDDFARLSKGRPSDYSALSYAKLRHGGGIQWPCNNEHPDGTERLYHQGLFWTHADRCQSFGHDRNALANRKQLFDFGVVHYQDFRHFVTPRFELSMNSTR